MKRGQMISPIKVFHETKCLGKLCSGLHEIRAKEARENLQGTETTQITKIPLISIKTALQKLPTLRTNQKKQPPKYLKAASILRKELF